MIPFQAKEFFQFFFDDFRGVVLVHYDCGQTGLRATFLVFWDVFDHLFSLPKNAWRGGEAQIDGIDGWMDEGFFFSSTFSCVV